MQANPLLCPRSAITRPEPSETWSASTPQPRAKGIVRLSAHERDGRSVIGRLHQSGSMKMLFPRVSTGPLQAVLINTAGGITGGDGFSVSAQAEAGAQLTLTTQAAERAYRAQPGETGRIVNRMSVAAGARLNWLPQETILFDGSALDRSLRIDLQEGAKLLAVEPLVFGRKAMGEELGDVVFADRIDIRRGGRPLYLDGMRLEGDARAHLARAGIAGGAGAMAALVYVAPDAEAHLNAIRAMLPETARAGASLIGEDLLALRALAPDSFELRRVLIPVLNRLTRNALPRCWMI